MKRTSLKEIELQDEQAGIEPAVAEKADSSVISEQNKNETGSSVPALKKQSVKLSVSIKSISEKSISTPAIDKSEYIKVSVTVPIDMFLWLDTEKAKRKIAGRKREVTIPCTHSDIIRDAIALYRNIPENERL